MKPQSAIHLPKDFRRLRHASEPHDSVLLDAELNAAVATDGHAIAILPFPDGFTLKSHRLIPFTDGKAIDCDDVSGIDCPNPWGWQAIEERATEVPAVFQIRFDAKKLLTLAAALGSSSEVILEFTDSERPFKVTAPGSEARGYLMSTGGKGLLVKEGSGDTPAAPATLPPPVVTYSTERQTIEISFGGKPDRATLDALKAPAIAFRYSGQKGTKRGVPACTWYGPDNPFTRQEIARITNTIAEQAA